MSRAKMIKQAKRVVIKIGSSILAKPGQALSHKALAGIAREVSFSEKGGKDTVIVSSGAIAAGMNALKFKLKPKKMPELQACAAVGQPILMQLYQKALDKSGLRGAQVLLDRLDLENEERRQYARNTLLELIKRRVIPIINENDAVFVEEIRVGDNDNLAAMVACLIDADLLILLTDQDGFYTADPQRCEGAQRIELVHKIDGPMLSQASGTLNPGSTGGMLTKLAAAKMATSASIPTIIADGQDKAILKKIYAGETIGTLFLP